MSVFTLHLVTSHRLLETGHNGSIYTMETNKHDRSRHFFIGELIVQHSPDFSWVFLVAGRSPSIFFFFLP